MVLADLQDAQFKVGGITVDWGTVGAAGGASTLPDQTPVVAGEKVLRFGQTLCRITATGKFGPYDSAASDGRQLLVPGDCFVLNRTVKENGFGANINTGATDHPQVFDGGTVWKARILMTTGTHSLAAGPTVAEFMAAFPRIGYAQS